MMGHDGKKEQLGRHDICHKHHNQCLCKTISNVGKMSYSEQISRIISKISVLLLVELVRKDKISQRDLHKFLWIYMLKLATYYDFG